MSSLVLLAGKNIYLILVQLVNKLFHKKNNKMIFLLSFPSTSEYALDLLYAEFKESLVICYTKNSGSLAQKYAAKGVPTYCIDNVPCLLTKIVPLVSGSKMILCDNYFAFLAGITLRSDAKVVQLWHADGAIKAFGLEANYTKKVSAKDRSRYQQVYAHFTHYVVSSSVMAEIFTKCYDTKINPLPFGYLPTDTFFAQNFVENSNKKFAQYFPSNKKVLLYVPTYREHESKVPIDFNNLQKELGEDWLILVKAHPHDTKLAEKLRQEKNIVTEFYDLTLEELLTNVDYLLTDYSSIAFEYPLANLSGKILFFWYDYEEYEKEVGIEKKFLKKIPGPVVKTEKELITALKEDKVQDLSSFNNYWNEYVDGSAGRQLIEWMKKNFKN